MDEFHYRWCSSAISHLKVEYPADWDYQIYAKKIPFPASENYTNENSFLWECETSEDHAWRVLCLRSFTKDDPHLAKMLQHTTYTRYEVHQVVNVTEDLKPPSLLWYWCTLTQIWEYGEDRYISLFKLLKNDMIMNDSQ